MKVVLMENVKGIGKKLDVVNVSEGYARNFLIPRNLAKVADNKSISEASSKKESMKFKQDQEREKATAQKEKLEKMVIEFRLRTADNGKLFGSITSKEISDKIKENSGIDIDKKRIMIEETIKTSGVYTVKIKLYEGIVASLRVRIAEV